MPKDELVVADTSPLLNLALVGRLELVREQFGSVTVPGQVWEELLAGEDGVNSLQSLRETGGLDVVTAEEGALFAEFRRDLDRGESAALSYAVETDADRLLLDEREARQAARRHEIPVTGAIGILLQAAQEGKISLRDELDSLRAAGFWISEDLYEEVLDRVDE